MLIDTVGMSTLLLPDLQYHFHGMDSTWVVNHATMWHRTYWSMITPFRMGKP